MSIGAGGQNEKMGEHDERKPDEREEHEAAVLPADKVVPIITSRSEKADAEEPERRKAANG